MTCEFVAFICTKSGNFYFTKRNKLNILHIPVIGPVYGSIVVVVVVGNEIVEDGCIALVPDGSIDVDVEEDEEEEDEKEERDDNGMDESEDEEADKNVEEDTEDGGDGNDGDDDGDGKGEEEEEGRRGGG